MERLDGTDNKAFQESEQARKELLAEDPSLSVLFDHPLNANKITPELLEKPEFQAIQSLVYDGEPEEVAQNFLNHGVESLKESEDLKNVKDKEKVKLHDALHCFEEGVKQKCKDNKINYELYFGVAKCHMYLTNFGKAKEAVKQGVKYKKTPEIYHCGAMSRFHVQKWQECVDYCKEALKLDKEHTPTKELMSKALTHVMEEKKKMDEMSLINQLEAAKKEKVYKEVMKYGIKIGHKLHFLPQDIGASLYIDDYNTLHFPVILLYDEFMQSDFIQDFPANSTFRDQLKLVLSQPAPWDPSHRYKLDNISVFYETNMSEPLDDRVEVIESDKKYKQVDLDSDLLSVLREESHIVPQYPIFIIVAKDFPEYGKYFQ